MTIKQLATKQIALRLTPLIGKMSDKGMGRFLSLAKTLAPTEFTRSFIEKLDQMRIKQDPLILLVKRMINQVNPRARERIINNLLVKQLMQGDVIRHKLWLEGNASTQTYLISPTMRCNLNCPGCYASQYSRQDDLPLDTIDRIVSEGEELGMFIVTILGGEPLVRPDLLEVFRKHKDVLFQVFTNGTLITPELVKELKRIGNVIITISLEGFEKETDTRRGEGVYRKVMQGMDYLREAGIPFGFSVMVTRQNLDVIISQEFNEMLVSKGALVGWHFLYIPAGQPDLSLMPTAEQREQLRQWGATYIRRKQPILLIDFWNDAPVVGGCIAGGQYYFHINNKGDVEPCIFVHLATDNINQKSLKQAVNSPFFKSIRKRQPYSENLLRPCMIIDHPQVLRDLYHEFQPYPTDGSQCGYVTSLADSLDNYSVQAAKVLDPVWKSQIACETCQAETCAAKDLRLE